jgi:hypothetical protein
MNIIGAVLTKPHKATLLNASDGERFMKHLMHGLEVEPQFYWCSAQGTSF